MVEEDITLIIENVTFIVRTMPASMADENTGERFVFPDERTIFASVNVMQMEFFAVHDLDNDAAEDVMELTLLAGLRVCVIWHGDRAGRCQHFR